MKRKSSVENVLDYDKVVKHHEKGRRGVGNVVTLPQVIHLVNLQDGKPGRRGERTRLFAALELFLVLLEEQKAAEAIKDVSLSSVGNPRTEWGINCSSL